jgi:hypothetical protein
MNNTKRIKCEEIIQNNPINLQERLMNSPVPALSSPPQSPPFRKHKLMLNTLNIVEKKE